MRRCEQKQTLYFLHERTEPGFVHSVQVAVAPVSDGRAIKWLLVLLGMLALFLALWIGKMRG